MAGDHDDRHAGLLGFYPAQQLDAIDFRHPDVEQYDCRAFARDEVHHAGRVAGIDDAKAFVA